MEFTLSDAQSWGLVIGSVSTAIVGIIGALKTEKVHKLVNSQLSQEKSENATLRAILAAKQIEIHTAEKTREALADAIVTRSRVTDASGRATAAAAATAVVTAAAVQAAHAGDPMHVIVDSQTPNNTPSPIPVVITDAEGVPSRLPLEVSVQSNGEKH